MEHEDQLGPETAPSAAGATNSDRNILPLEASGALREDNQSTQPVPQISGDQQNAELDAELAQAIEAKLRKNLEAEQFRREADLRKQLE